MRHKRRIEDLERQAAGLKHVPGEFAELERLLVHPSDEKASWWRWVTFARYEALACVTIGRGDRSELWGTVTRCEQRTAESEASYWERDRHRLAAESHLLAVDLFTEPQLREFEAYRLEHEPDDPLFGVLTEHCRTAYGPGVHVRGRRGHPWQPGLVEVLDGERLLATATEFWEVDSMTLTAATA